MQGTKGVDVYREKFMQIIEKLCLQSRDYYDYSDTILTLVDSSIDKKFNPIVYWKFTPIYSFEVDSKGYLGKSYEYKHHPLLYRNGTLIDFVPNITAKGITDIVEGYELWMLDNMSLIVTYCCSVAVDKGDIFERITYRYPVKDGISKYEENFDIDAFLKFIHKKIKYSMYGESDNCLDEDEKSCYDCPNKYNCPFKE